jgi:hypothetical protein
MRRLAPLLAVVFVLVLTSAVLPTAGTRAALPAQAATPLQTFEIVVATEWQPRGEARLADELAAAGCPADDEASFLRDLEQGLRSFAAYFYSYTGGQMAISKISIYSNGEQWENADIRVLANRSYRPTAFIGGITNTPRPYDRDGDGRLEALFFPAPILLSRLWDGEGARCGAWSAPEGWRTIGHEWGHYALYLYDEYYNQRTGRQQLCDRDAPGFALLGGGPAPAAISSTVQSLMAYHYTADALSRWEPGAPPSACQDSPQDVVHGASNWATVARFYPGVTAPPVTQPGPTFDQATLEVVSSTATLTATAASVQLAGPARPGLVGESYLLRPHADGAPQRIIGQGNLIAGETLPARFWGVQPSANDRATVLLADFLSGERLSFPPDTRAPTNTLALQPEGVNTLPLSRARWQPEIRVEPHVTVFGASPIGDLTGLRVRLRACNADQLGVVEMAYCPAGGDCGQLVRASPTPDGFEAFFSFLPGKPPAPYGYIYAREASRGAEAVIWYQNAGGVGPARSTGHAPTADGLLSVDLPQNTNAASDRDNRVIYSPALVCALTPQLPPGITRLVGQPLDVQITVGDGNGGQGWDGPQPPRVRLGYTQELLDRLGADEGRLVVLQLVQSGVWQVLPTAGRSSALDWVAAQPVAFRPGGEVFVLAEGPPTAALPLIIR